MKMSKVMQEILYGVAVGDALGFPVQFAPRSDRKENPVLDMGVLQNDQSGGECIDTDEIGLWSDDTSLTLCLATSLLHGFSLKDQAERFIAWLDNGYLSALDRAFDVGNTTTVTLTKVRSILKRQDYALLSHLGNTVDVSANGNGSLMRILPLILHIKGKDIFEQFEIVWLASAITHPHIRSALACMAYLRFAEHIIDGCDKYEAYRKMRHDMVLLMDDIICPNAEHQALDRVVGFPIHKLSEDEIKSDGYVISSLEAALWCVLNQDSYQETVLTAVNLGWDTDTTAAIAGGLAALIYGFESIPPEWVAALQKPYLFTQLIEEYRVKEAEER